MKIKVLSRDATEHTRTRPKELQKVSHNADPKLHPFEKPLEYTRALVAVKTNRMFAKPFIRSLDGHRDSVYTICKHPQKISLLASGSADGEVRLWDASTGYVYKLKIHHLIRSHSDHFRAIRSQFEHNSSTAEFFNSSAHF